MKLIALFLCQVVLILSIAPCCAQENITAGLQHTANVMHQENNNPEKLCREDVGTSSEEVPLCTNDHVTCNDVKNDCVPSEENGKQQCSPFYVCGTCFGFWNNNKSIIWIETPFKWVTHSSTYLEPSLSLIALHIWQPPKLLSINYRL